PTVAFYECGKGGWIHLHGGFPALEAGTRQLLGCTAHDDREAIADAVSRWDAADLEDALAAAGLCGARARTPEEWLAHDQGAALADLPVVEVLRIGEADPRPLPAADRPLRGVRVLDLTRVLAGPTAGRTLAAHGADVLRVGSPHLPSIEPFVIDTGHGKRSCHLDLDTRAGADTLRSLVAEADVFTSGYRAGSLDKRGFGPEALAAIRPGLVYVSINAYGYVGPWRERPGWEQLAQTATGVAVEQGSSARPQLLPAAATDYTTGYLAAYGAIVARHRQATEGGSWWVRVSLAQTAMWVLRAGSIAESDAGSPAGPGDLAEHMIESDTAWGQLTHLGPALHMSVTPPVWERPTAPLGTHAPVWLDRDERSTAVSTRP
ncbi:MAG: CoA transferase, partial [Acidimicrobiales bacterium]